MPLDFSPRIRVPQEAIAGIPSGVGNALEALQGGLEKGSKTADLLRKRRAQQELVAGLGGVGIEGISPKILQSLAEIDPGSAVTLLTQELRNKKTSSEQRPFGVDESGRIRLRDPKASLSAQESQVLLRQRSIEAMNNRIAKQMQIATKRLQDAKTSDERQAAQAILNSLSDIFLKVNQPEVFGQIGELAPGAISTLGGLVGKGAPAAGPVQPPPPAKPATDAEAKAFLSQNYPSAKQSPADIKWAKDQLNARR